MNVHFEILEVKRISVDCALYFSLVTELNGQTLEISLNSVKKILPMKKMMETMAKVFVFQTLLIERLVKLQSPKYSLESTNPFVSL
jgi:hypothetical protein